MSDLAQWIAYQRRAAVFGTSEETVLALLDVVEAAKKYRIANDASEDISCDPRRWASKECEDAAVAVIAAEERLDAAIARLAEVAQ